jgi:hypothetical protein
MVRPPPSAHRTLALGRLRPGAQNKTEAEYRRILEARKQAGEIEWYAFEGITFKLADDTRYTPDFAVMLAGGAMEMHEIKGRWMDDAKVKIKVAADKFPFRFIAVYKLSKKDGGGWRYEPY